MTKLPDKTQLIAQHDHALIPFRGRLHVAYVSTDTMDEALNGYGTVGEFIRENGVFSVTRSRLFEALNEVLRRDWRSVGTVTVKGAQSTQSDEPLTLRRDDDVIILCAPCGAVRYLDLNAVRKVRLALKNGKL